MTFTAAHLNLLFARWLQKRGNYVTIEWQNEDVVGITQKGGTVTIIETKVSWPDFLADFKNENGTSPKRVG